MNAAAKFRIAMGRAGLVYAGPIAADGRLHRFKAEGDKARNCWYVLHPGPPTAGAFGCWKRSIKETWCERELGEMSQAQWSEVRRCWQEAERERERTETERHTKARNAAAWILNRTKAAQFHPYLERKGAKIFGDLRDYRGSLALPLLDASGGLHSLQFIGADGEKRFLSGGRTSGCFFTLHKKPTGPLVICEGYATGASIHEATGHAVVSAMNCGNLAAATTALRAKWPAREIIIAADNDQWTQGNPGMTQAAEAAKTIRARLAMPQFKATTSKPTDFNDLHQLEGLDTVKEQIESATVPTETEQETFARLAKLPQTEYDRCRGSEAKRLRIRPGTLDSEVAKHRPASAENLQGGGLNLGDVELWPEPVNGAEVLNAVAVSFGRYIVLPDGAADALALWCTHAHAFKEFPCSPRLAISSPEKRCGKTTLRDVLTVLVPRPLATENLSVAVLFRAIEKFTPTVLADEYDAWLRDNEELRGLLNAGHRRGGQVFRCVGDDHEVRGFRVFAPTVLCGIGELPGTLQDRSISIRLKRAKEGELPERFDSRHTEREQILCRKLARFCADSKERLAQCEPTLPPSAFNRLADNWRPLFAIAEIAGGEWPGRAAAAFAKLTAQEDADSQGMGTMLLADIRQTLAEKPATRVFSKSLVDSLCAMTDRPWPEANKGKAITEAWLARRLHSFGIKPRGHRIGDGRARGYEVADFVEPFQRYLSTPGFSNRDTVTNVDPQAVTDFLKRDNGEPCHGFKSTQTIANTELSRCHTSNPRMRGSQES